VMTRFRSLTRTARQSRAIASIDWLALAFIS
jgi:hypothetical protein